VKAFTKLYPECGTTKIDTVEIPKTVVKKLYFVQSPKDDSGKSTKMYSLRTIMLDNLRLERISARARLAEADKNGDKLGMIRYNAMQLAIKVISNSDYGTSQNEFFPHYEPDIAGATTCNARRLINFLTNALQSDGIYVDRKFLDDNKKDLDRLIKIDALSIDPYTGPREDLFNLRRRCLASLFDVFNGVKPDIEIFKLNIVESRVLYQDTDSNYYRTDYIVDHFFSKGISPEIIDECMYSLMSHNNIFSSFVKRSVNRAPVGVGFEGAFIICRYLNRKKKYYGRKWEPGMKTTLPEAAYINNILKDDYSAQWTPKTILPRPNGDYLYLDIEQLLFKAVNQLDYVNKHAIKCTGVDLARRDQFKFINFSHMRIIQQDMRIMKYDGNNSWAQFNIDEPMKKVIDDVVKSFRDTINAYTKISNLTSAEKPEYPFTILDFAKTGAYREGKLNAVTSIVARLKKEGKPKYIPSMGERMFYVICMDEATKASRAMGRVGAGRVADRSLVIEELLDILHEKYPLEMFEEHRPEGFNITYDEFINAKAICELDHKYYLECLCKSTALYIVGDIYPEDIKRIDDGVISSEEANKLITKRQDDIARMYLDEYFPSGAKISSNIKQVTKKTDAAKIYEKMSNDDLSVIYKLFPNHSNEPMTKKLATALLEIVESQLEKFNTAYKPMKYIREFVLTNNFIEYYTEDPFEMKLYNKIKTKSDNEIVDELTRLSNNISGYTKARDILKHALAER
jgi:hypothetical protein